MRLLSVLLVVIFSAGALGIPRQRLPAIARDRDAGAKQASDISAGVTDESKGLFAVAFDVHHPASGEQGEVVIQV